jgi:hypothetical protein
MDCRSDGPAVVVEELTIADAAASFCDRRMITPYDG